MKRFMRIAGSVVAVLALLAAGGFSWMLLKPHPATEIVEPGPTGGRIVEGPIFANFYPAPTEVRRPGILRLGGSEGGLGADVQRQALLLQRVGYNVLHLAYFNVPGKSSKLEFVRLEEFHRGLAWLRRQASVDADAIAIVGYSKGAEAALLTATTYPGVRAVVAGMPSSVAGDGMSARSYMLGGTSSWTRDGEPVSSLAYGEGDGSENLLPRFTNALKELHAHLDTVIPVERFDGKLLLICGERDVLWPACPMARMIEARARWSGRPDVLLLSYAEAGHGVMGAPLPPEHRTLPRWTKLGGSARANADARADSWPRIMRFLSENLS